MNWDGDLYFSYCGQSHSSFNLNLIFQLKKWSKLCYLKCTLWCRPYLYLVFPKHPQEVHYCVGQRTLSSNVSPGVWYSLHTKHSSYICTNHISVGTPVAKRTLLSLMQQLFGSIYLPSLPLTDTGRESSSKTLAQNVAEISATTDNVKKLRTA